MVARRQAGSWSPPTSSPTAPTPPASRRRSRSAPLRRRRPVSPIGSSSGGGTAGRTALRTHVWKVPARPDGGAAVDLTPGDRDAPPFAVGGGHGLGRLAGRARSSSTPRTPTRTRPSRPTPTSSWCRFAGRRRRRRTSRRPIRRSTARRAIRPTASGSPTARRSARASKRTGFASCSTSARPGQIRGLTETFDFWVEDFRWTPDSKSIVYVAEVRGREMLYRVPLAGAGGQPVELWTGGGVAGARGRGLARRVLGELLDACPGDLDRSAWTGARRPRSRV